MATPTEDKRITGHVFEPSTVNRDLCIHVAIEGVCGCTRSRHSMQPLNMHYRYVAEQDTDQIREPGLWLLLDTALDNVDVGGQRWFTESEAKVCEWALNIIVRGGTLEARIPVGNRVMSNGDNATEFERPVYDGPVEGIF